MSSWLSGGLNQLTDQITTFTKEVLTETTEEVTDPGAELHVMRLHYEEMKRSHQYQQAEYEKLKLHCAEQKERAETAEYQVSTISQEYRRCVEARDGEIRRLKLDNEKLHEQSKDVEFSSPLRQLGEVQLGRSSGSLARLAEGQLQDADFESVNFDGGLEWTPPYDHTFSDIITSQTEINNLRMELSKEREELQRCKSAAERKEQDVVRVKEATEKKLTTLTAGHKEELGQLQEQVRTLQHQALLQHGFTSGGQQRGSPAGGKQPGTPAGGQQRGTPAGGQQPGTPAGEHHRMLELDGLNSSLMSQLDHLKSKNQPSSVGLESAAGQVQGATGEENLHTLHREKEQHELLLKDMVRKIAEQEDDVSRLQVSLQLSQTESSKLQRQVEVQSSLLGNKNKELEMMRRAWQRDSADGDQLNEALEAGRGLLADGRSKFDLTAAAATHPAPVERSLGGSPTAEKNGSLMETSNGLEDRNSAVQEVDRLKEEVAVLTTARSLLEVRVHNMEEEVEFVRGQARRRSVEGKQEGMKKSDSSKYLNDDPSAARRPMLVQQDASLQTSVSPVAVSQRSRDSLEREVADLREQRDDALLCMSNAQQQAEQNAESMDNLQNVLEHLQRDQASELGEALKRSQLELADSLSECQHLNASYAAMHSELEEARTVAEAAALLNQELDARDSIVTQLNQEVCRLQLLLEEGSGVRKPLSSAESALVDRDLVKNLVLGYLLTSEENKVEVLHLIAKILEFSASEMEQACKGRGRGSWLGGLWKTSSWAPPESPSSLSHAFVNFLESESSPKHGQEPLDATRALSPSSTHVPGYIDPLTDPDRPSLSTVTLLSSVPGSMHKAGLSQDAPPRASPAEHGKVTTHVTSTPAPQTHLHHQSGNSFQSSLLRSVLKS